MTRKILPVFLSLIAFCCNAHDPAFKYIKFKEYHFERGYLKPLSEIELLSVSGGKPCDGTDIYLYQFVVIDKATKDTLKILSPCQIYDEVQAPGMGIFIPIGNTLDSINNYLNKDEKANRIEGNHVFVVVNSKHFTELRDYKTLVGGIGFK